MDEADCVVIGAGVVGLAAARALARAGREVMILEAEKAIGSGTSSRNSEVIHAGLYYPPGSLKAESCLEGRDRLYAYCAANNVPHHRCGKLIVAANEGQRTALDDIAARAAANGVADLEALDAAALKAMEPEAAGIAALHSPSTGILDSHAFMLALLGEAEAQGALLARACRVTRLRPGANAIDLWIEGEGSPVLRARAVINAGGLAAHLLAGAIDDFPAEHVPGVRFAKGNYFLLAGRSPFSRLVYPVPEPGGLGVHLTLDLAGAARFGPDVQWVEAVGYDVDPAGAEGFASAIRAYWPRVRAEMLRPGYAGIRPKVPGGDFILSGPADHGVAGLVNLFGIESPGLTASLALADRVVAALEAA